MVSYLVAVLTPAASAQMPSPTVAGAGSADEITVELPRAAAPMAEPTEVVEHDNVAVIPAGQEELLSEMLGRGATLAGGCKLSAGDVKNNSVVATYACPAGSVAFELVHPDKAAPGAVKTERFGITIKSGTAPDGFADDLIARIRAREGKFEWKWVGVPRVPRSAARPPVWWVVGAGVLLVAVVLAVLRWRRAR